MAVNALLIRWAGGWTEHVDTAAVLAHGRIEAFLDLGSIGSLAEVQRIAAAQLDEFANPRVQTDIAIEPRDDDETPYVGVNVGDTITVDGESHRILGMAVSVDEETGRLIFVPSLNDNVVLDPMSRVAQAVGKLIPGSLGGRSKAAQAHIPPYVPRGFVPAAGFAAPVCLSESFDTADSPTIGPDLAWDKASFYTTADGVVHSNTFSVWDSSGANLGAARCDIVEQTALGYDDMAVEAPITAAAAVGTGANQDPYHWFRMYARSGGVSGNYAEGWFVNVVGATVGNGGNRLDIGYQSGSGANVRASTSISAPAPGDVVRMEVTGSGATLEIVAKINGSTVLTADITDLVSDDAAGQRAGLGIETGVKSSGHTNYLNKWGDFEVCPIG